MQQMRADDATKICNADNRSAMQIRHQDFTHQVIIQLHHSQNRITEDGGGLRKPSSPIPLLKATTGGCPGLCPGVF